MKKRKYAVAAVILILCMALSIFSNVLTSRWILKDNAEKDLRILTAMIDTTVSKAFLRPITVAETMSKDTSLRENISDTVPDRAEDVEETISRYLESIRKEFGYSMVYAISDATNIYYTYNGISTVIDPYNNKQDEWYRNAKESGKSYLLDVDTDEAANWDLSVFINKTITDKDNHFLGICGVGVSMSQLQSMFERYERVHQIKINLIDRNGLIQIDTDGSRIEQDYIIVEKLSEMSDGEYYYEILPEGDRVITYNSDLDWYLVVTDTANAFENSIRYIVPCLVIFAFGTALIIGTFAVDHRLEKKRLNKEV